MSKTSKKTCLFHASQPSGSELLKWGIPPFRNFKMEGSIRFSSFLKEMSSYYQCFSSTSRDSQILNCIEEFSMFAVYVKYWTINHFSHSYKRRHLLAIFSSNPSFWKILFWGIPRFGNFFFEGSLVLEISILRDPSFQEFWDRHKTNRFFGGLAPFFVPFFSF